MERKKEPKVGRQCLITNPCVISISFLMHQVFFVSYLQSIYDLTPPCLFLFFQSYQRTSFVFIGHLYYIFISTSLISAHLCHLLLSAYFGFFLSTPLPCNFKLQNSIAGRRQDLALPSHFIKRPRGKGHLPKILQLGTVLPHSLLTASFLTPPFSFLLSLLSHSSPSAQKRKR